MERFILDTNLFFNMESGLGIGTKTEEVVVLVTKGIKRLKSQGQIEYYMTPKIIDEFLSFFENKNQLFIHDFMSTLITKSPDLHSLSLPAYITGQIIDEVRNRAYRGQNAAEEEILQAGKEMSGETALDKKEFEIKIGSVIKRFRARYRQATRFGFIDSIADFELIMLARELDGFLVSSDEGVIKWARIFGVKEMSAPLFGKKLLG